MDLKKRNCTVNQPNAFQIFLQIQPIENEDGKKRSGGRTRPLYNSSAYLGKHPDD